MKNEGCKSGLPDLICQYIFSKSHARSCNKLHLHLDELWQEAPGPISFWPEQPPELSENNAILHEFVIKYINPFLLNPILCNVIHSPVHLYQNYHLSSNAKAFF